MKIALLISGGGTTATAIIKACLSGKLKNVAPALVIASSSGISGIERVKATGFPSQDILTIDPKLYKSSKDFGFRILQECQSRGVDFIGQYGWLCKTPANIIETYKGMMSNQHPGPLDIGRPDFGGKGMFGLRVSAARLMFVNKTNHDFWTEATCQRVALEFDQGAVLRKKRVPILPGDTPEILAARMLPVEHEVQIEVLQRFANNTVNELIRKTPLVLPKEYAVLEICKNQAIKLYPKG